MIFQQQLIGAIHKLRCQDFKNFAPFHLLTILLISLCSNVECYLTLAPFRCLSNVVYEWPIQKDDDHHSPIDCQKVQGLIDLLREIHAIFMMDQFGHINGILISGRIFAIIRTTIN